MRIGKFKFTFFRVLFLIITVLYLAVTLVPFLSSGGWWFIAILGLIFPFLLILEILFLIIWAIKRSRLFFLSIIVLLLSWQQISVLVAFRTASKNVSSISDGTLRVLSWNVSRWNLGNSTKEDRMVYRNLMLDFISSEQADVLCFQEFFESHDEPLYGSTIEELERRGYKHYYFFPSYAIYEGKFEFGLAIFSKHPINNAEGFLNDSKGHSEGFIYADISIKGTINRFFNFHTESPGFDKEDYEEKGSLKFGPRILRKLMSNYTHRNKQVELARNEINKSPYSVILCGDLGDIPNSYAYFKIKGNLADAFLKKGRGFGRTYRHISPTLRIDYLFVDKKIKVESYFVPKVIFSDHFPVISDLNFQE